VKPCISVRIQRSARPRDRVAKALEITAFQVLPSGLTSVDRTQEVAGSSPASASSIEKCLQKGDFTANLGPFSECRFGHEWPKRPDFRRLVPQIGQARNLKAPAKEGVSGNDLLDRFQEVIGSRLKDCKLASSCDQLNQVGFAAVYPSAHAVTGAGRSQSSADEAEVRLTWLRPITSARRRSRSPGSRRIMCVYTHRLNPGSVWPSWTMTETGSSPRAADRPGPAPATGRARGGCPCCARRPISSGRPGPRSS
jgi:hypothetical protein